MEQTDLQELLDGLLADKAVPGAVLGVSVGGVRRLAAGGLANAATRSPMTVDTGFLIGSLGKVWVTSLLMVLIEAGSVGLDSRVRDVLPELRLGDEEAAGSLTVRHLLTHTSGIDAADHCPDDLGTGVEAVARYVASLAGVDNMYAPGELWSYCNPGFVIAGRIVEVTTGKFFAHAMHDLLLEPLGLRRTLTSAEDAILWPAAVGHFPDPSTGLVRRTTRYLLPQAMSPAGTTMSATLDDALGFAEMHLGRGPRVLSQEAIGQMAAHQVDLPITALGSFGLGWGRPARPDGTVVLSHGGGSLGGLAQLVVVPSADVAVVAFGNSALAAELVSAACTQVLSAAGVPRDVNEPDPGTPADAALFAGTFRRREFTTRIRVEGADLLVETTPDPTNAVLRAYGASSPTVVRCRPTGPRSFSLPPAVAGAVPSAAGFLVGEEYLYMGGRLSRRVEGRH